MDYLLFVGLFAVYMLVGFQISGKYIRLVEPQTGWPQGEYIPEPYQTIQKDLCWKWPLMVPAMVVSHLFRNKNQERLVPPQEQEKVIPPFRRND